MLPAFRAIRAIKDLVEASRTNRVSNLALGGLVEDRARKLVPSRPNGGRGGRESGRVPYPPTHTVGERSIGKRGERLGAAAAI